MNGASPRGCWIVLGSRLDALATPLVNRNVEGAEWNQDRMLRAAFKLKGALSNPTPQLDETLDQMTLAIIRRDWPATIQLHDALRTIHAALEKEITT